MCLLDTHSLLLRSDIQYLCCPEETNHLQVQSNYDRALFQSLRYSFNSLKLDVIIYDEI